MKDIFTPDMRLSDMIDMNYNLMQVISRMGIGLNYAGMTAGEACRQFGLDTRTFMLICNVYSFPEYDPSQSEIASASISDIVRYLRGSHAYYTGLALNNLEASVNRLLEPCDIGRKTAIMKFFIDYKVELEKHFAREEDEVFPYIEALQSGGRPEEYSIDQFEEHHESVDEKLEDMKNIVMMYLPAECDPQMRMWVLVSVYSLRDDLRRHTYVEDNILVPAVRKLEYDGE